MSWSILLHCEGIKHMLSFLFGTLAVIRNDVEPEEIINFFLILGYLLIDHKIFKVVVIHAEYFIRFIVIGHMIDQFIDMLHHVPIILQIIRRSDHYM